MYRLFCTNTVRQVQQELTWLKKSREDQVSNLYTWPTYHSNIKKSKRPEGEPGSHLPEERHENELWRLEKGGDWAKTE